MCGISGTIFRREFIPGPKVTSGMLQIKFDSLLEGNTSVSEFLDIVWTYKSNVNFLRYCHNKTERVEVRKLCKHLGKLAHDTKFEIDEIDKKSGAKKFKKKYKDYESLLDCEWFLKHEIPNLKLQIQDLANSSISSISDSSIIFYKNLALVLNSINERLEIRGRDSFGLAIQFLSTNKFDDRVLISPDKQETLIIENKKNHSTVSFIFKTASQIGLLGDNYNKVINIIKKNDFIKELLADESVSLATIVAHTRWASVGEVNVPNCHPISNLGIDKNPENLVLASLNGDIHNYRELISQSPIPNKEFDPECTTDCLAIPVSFTGVAMNDEEQIRTVLRKYQGSFAIALQSSDNFGKILLVNSGNQGLYLGLSYDGIMFASDVYGLIENCKYFMRIDSGCFLDIGQSSDYYNASFHKDVHRIDGGSRKYTLLDFDTTNITTRDIDRKGYTHFLLKEIMETKDIVERTIENYLQPEDLIQEHRLQNSIRFEENEVPNFIINDLKDKKINEIVITGMGTCYTAAVAISRYMRTLLRNFVPDIQVEPHIASEGSAFYLRPSMQNTLVIVIAQSGTTVDTNVYVQMAKERGASTLAITNKREGDVTFLVDGRIYLGSGRDIEIAVPSTKTYTAQVILGYILTIFFCSRLISTESDKRLIFKNIVNLRGVPKLITRSFESLSGLENIEAIYEYPLKYNSWCLAYDTSPNSVCAMEIRIKYSEGCYQSLPYFDIKEIEKMSIRNSFITYITNEKADKIIENLGGIMQRGNSLIIITSCGMASKALNKYILNRKICLIDTPEVDNSYSFVPTIIAGQLLSYYSAIALDKRKDIILKLKIAITHGDNIESNWNDFYSHVREGMFNQGFSIFQLSHLKSLYNSFKETGFDNDRVEKIKILAYLKKMHLFSIRSIDTIKHQAKTLTVGAIRRATISGTRIFESEKFMDLLKTSKIDIVIDANVTHYLIIIFGIDEAYGYFMTSYLNDFAIRNNLDVTFSLGHDYNFSSSKDNCNSIIIFDGEKINLSQVRKFPPSKYDIILDISCIKKSGINHIEIETLKSSLSCLYFASNISYKILDSKGYATGREHSYFEKNLKELDNALNYLINSENISSSIKTSAKFLLQKVEAWKNMCI